MAETSVFKFPYPTNSDSPAGPAQIEAAVKKVEEKLLVIELLITGTPSAGQLVIVGGTSHPEYKSVTGDVTFNSSGVATLGAEKVTSAKIKLLAVEAAQLASNAVTAAKLASESVETAKIKLLAVTTATLAAEAVTTGKIALGAITAALMAAESIETAAIKDGAVTQAKLAASAKPFTWYTPKSIETEESRTNVAFGTLPTPDEITGIVVPTDGLVLIGYRAIVKASVGGSAARAAIFIGANQLTNYVGTSNEAVIDEGSSEVANSLVTYNEGLKAFTGIGEAALKSGTGVVLGNLVPVFMTAGTYTVSVRYKASSGSVTAKNRKLWVGVMGV